MGITAIPSGVKGHWSWNFNCVEHCECSHLIFPTASVKWVLLALSTAESIASRSCWLIPRESQIIDGFRAGWDPTTVWHSLITLLQASPSSRLRFHLAVKVSQLPPSLGPSLSSPQALICQMNEWSRRRIWVWVPPLGHVYEQGWHWFTPHSWDVCSSYSQQGNKTTRKRATGS